MPFSHPCHRLKKICPASFRETCQWLKFPLNRLRAQSRVSPVVGLLTLFHSWQKVSWQTSEETFRYVRPERVNKWPNSMTDIWWWWLLAVMFTVFLSYTRNTFQHLAYFSCQPFWQSILDPITIFLIACYLKTLFQVQAFNNSRMNLEATREHVIAL